jgi:long-chain acyl-CoA synthetase
MKSFPVYQILEESAKKWPDRPAVHDEWGSLSFAALFEEAEKIRDFLLGQDIGKGMGIGLRARNGRRFIAGLFAIAGTGAAVMPIYHQLKKPEIDEILGEARLQAILDDGSGPSTFSAPDALLPLEPESLRLNFIGANRGIPFAPHVRDPAFIRYTSGTTGKSKGVIISHPSVLERIEAANKGLGLGPEDTVVWVLPMAYHFVVSIVLYIRFGAAIAVAKDFLARNILEITRQFQGTLLYASPLQIRLLAADPGEQKMDSLRRVISTSAGISLETCLAFKKRFGLDVSQAYGIIEIGLPLMNFTKSAEHPDAAGYALPDFEVAILDDAHRPVPDGRPGHLGIRGPGMFDAYLVPACRREDVLVNGYFLTADLASRSPEGLIKIEGRTKSVINISGIKIFPEEIEALLESIPGIAMARVSSRPHRLLGQIIEAELLPSEGAKIDTEEIMRICRRRLSNFKTPQEIRIVSELPMTATGKLRRD